MTATARFGAVGAIEGLLTGDQCIAQRQGVGHLGLDRGGGDASVR
jgi:hypothetical protein